MLTVWIFEILGPKQFLNGKQMVPNNILYLSNDDYLRTVWKHEYDKIKTV